ncbi:MAG: holo-ACP synthase [Spirochaetia bacterium]
MILGMGIDIVSVERMRHWWNNERLLRRFFHDDEIEAVQHRKSGSILSLAARFAAKEAFGKALGTGMRGLVLRDIQVVNSHNGKPDIQLYGTALEAFHRHRGQSIHLTMTHEHDMAVALIVIEGD